MVSLNTISQFYYNAISNIIQVIIEIKLDYKIYRRLIPLPSTDLIPDVFQRQQFGFDGIDVQQYRVAAVELGQDIALNVAVGEEFTVVEVALVAGDTVVVPEIGGIGAFFVGQKGLIHFFAVTDADDLRFMRRAEQFFDRLCQRADGACGSFLYQYVSGFAEFESEQNEVNGFFERHDKARHLRFGHGYRLSCFDLFDKKRYDRSPRAHDIAVADAAYFGFVCRAALGDDHLFHHGFACPHRVDRISRFIGRKAYDALDSFVDSRCEDIVGSEDVGFDGFKGEEFTGGNLLQRSGVEYVIDAVHRIPDRSNIADVADIEFNLVRLVFVPHIVLLLFVAREDAYLTDIGVEETVKDSVAKRSGPAGYE